MGYSVGFMRSVSRFERRNTPREDDLVREARSSLGLEQFHGLESKGYRPENPDPYFSMLLSGKSGWNFVVKDLSDLYFGHPEGGWPGWFMLAHDFMDDRDGFRQIACACGAADRVDELWHLRHEWGR